MINVYVTGIGMISALGPDVATALNTLQQSRSGLGPIHHVTTRLQGRYVAGEVSFSDNELAMLAALPDAELTRTTLLGYLAAREAWQHAGLGPADTARTGLISASTVGGTGHAEHFYQDFLEARVTPAFIDTYDNADSTEFISRRLGIRDLVTTVNTACASSANAIVLGARLIQQGVLDRVVVGGTDALARFTLNGFNSLLLLDPEPCKPFDANRKGINLGEGAAYLVLEAEATARQRKAPLRARLSGYGLTNDAHHQTASSPTGYGLQLAMHQALRRAALPPEAIGYLNAHGTGTANNDLTEGQAIRAVFPDQAPPFSSTKPFTGHALGAAGGIEAVLSVLALNQGLIWPSLNFAEPIPDHGLVPVRTLRTVPNLHHVLSTSAAMGGSCCALLFSQP
ncbi:beta-ketoacyl-[acyl-carrier-protein] synthase family protein [Hymenobacter sp. NST-14]|uniref:beta-ketoacyl-[acyl-carrier-protein] synthase family protein n=1 Tax=Hymenobacter piscis TaxID=2839984 RepID=UPI001C02FD8A|nr:beta-ketoacyl-[acyl-carrier-protein] synthase family protein [Hymenobacter piscis]MBT9393137.1 beta-ketoacyl-[acyl-carrier-protein] synthase family protein [Hymenobacter piscis]